MIIPKKFANVTFFMQEIDELVASSTANFLPWSVIRKDCNCR